MIDLDVKVKPTALSLRFITESLKCKDERWDELRALKTLKDVQFSVVSGNGYLSTITRISFFFEGQKEPFSVILKVRTMPTNLTGCCCRCQQLRMLRGLWARLR